MKALRATLFNFIGIFCVSILLVGCSYFDADGDEELRVSQSTGDVRGINQSDYAREPVSAAEAIARHTGGRVQIFDLDAPALQDRDDSEGAQPVSSAPIIAVEPIAEPQPVPRVFSTNPGVEIFPFEDFVPTAVQLPAVGPPPPVEQVAREEDYVAVEKHDGDKIIVYFGHDSSALSQEAQGKISSVASRFNKASGQGITVEGHSSAKANYNDAAQRKIVNLKISMDRAFAVARSLIQKGIPADFIRVMAWGDVRPPLETEGKTAEEAARRVEISG